MLLYEHGPLNRIGRVHCQYERNALYYCTKLFIIIVWHHFKCVSICAVRVRFLFYFEGVAAVHFQTRGHITAWFQRFWEFQQLLNLNKNKNLANGMLFWRQFGKCFCFWMVFSHVICPLTMYIDWVHVIYIRMQYHRPLAPAVTTSWLTTNIATLYRFLFPFILGKSVFTWFHHFL